MRLLVIGLVWPESASSAAGTRMLQLLELFLEAGFEVLFGSAAQRSEHADVLESIGIETRPLLLNDDAFDDFVKAHQPDFVLFDRFISEEQFGWRVAESCPNALRILDTEDLHCLRFARQLAVRENREMVTEDLMSDVAKREIASILRSDLSLMISRFEMQLLAELFKVDDQRLCYLPFLERPLTDQDESNWKNFDERSDFLFIGNFHHEPNRDAVLHLKSKIWPLVRERLPQAVIKIYGAYAPPGILQLHKPKDGFHVCGRAASAAEAISNARVMLAPLRFGAGLKGKLLEAMRHGTPSITTPVGAEAMTADGSWNGRICESDVDFAKAAVTFYTDELAWRAGQRIGLQLINTQFNRDIWAKNFILKLMGLKECLEELRRHNFIGAVLLHHTAASTKYMSRWIQEKNRQNVNG